MSKVTMAMEVLTIVLSALCLLAGLPARATSQGLEWALVVDGSVANSLNLTYEEIQSMPRTTVYAELYCVDFPSFALARGNWTGVKLAYLLEKSQVLPGALKIAFHANDGYASDLPLATGMRNDTIVAFELNGQTLSENLRLVVPGKWGYKWVSGLAHIQIINYDFKGTWESMGYSDEASILFLRADLNKDGYVNTGDLTIVVAAFGAEPEDLKWNEAADMDWNGLINVVDLTLVAKNYGKIGDL